MLGGIILYLEKGMEKYQRKAGASIKARDLVFPPGEEKLLNISGQPEGPTLVLT